MSKASKSNSKILSTWTPLNHEENNKNVFSDRRELVCKWYEKWNESQRKKIIQDLLKLSGHSQLQFADELLMVRLPTKECDFTRLFPRVITLYIFSFLDPRTLCRCAQVCWYWKYLAELDQLWMIKCLKLGWNLSFSPGPYEHGLWKRNYVENLKSLQYLKSQMDQKPYIPPSTPVPSIDLSTYDLKNLSFASPKSVKSAITTHSKSARKPSGPLKPAWRGSDPNPKDTWRFNYLNNDDDVEIVKALRAHGLSGPRSAIIADKAKSKVKTGKNVLNTKPKSVNLELESWPSTARSIDIKDDEKTDGFEETLEDKIYGGRPEWAKPVITQQNFPQSKSEINLSTNSAFTLQNKTLIDTIPIRSDNNLPVSGAFEVFTHKPWRVEDHNSSD